ncbi:MAG: hypothetical protein J7M30_01060 [Deltaproteobacteria bacterium]|nr:hypothetical protein [Deltaproteobacteria bacterium]
MLDRKAVIPYSISAKDGISLRAVGSTPRPGSETGGRFATTNIQKPIFWPNED